MLQELEYLLQHVCLLSPIVPGQCPGRPYKRRFQLQRRLNHTQLLEGQEGQNECKHQDWSHVHEL